MKPAEQTLEGMRLFPSNLAITTKFPALLASSHSFRSPARSAAEPLTTEKTQIRPCADGRMSKESIHRRVDDVMFRVHVTSSVRLMFIPNRVSPSSGISSTGTSATPGRYHSLMPCTIWGAAPEFCCLDRPVELFFSFNKKFQNISGQI